MNKFERAVEKTIALEGGFTDHLIAGDNGGRTYAGISIRSFPKWRGWKLIDNDADFQSIRRAVLELYKAEFYDRIKGDQIDDERVAQTIFDFAVNTGVKPAVKAAQRVLGVRDDGIIGPITLRNLNGFDSELFLSLYAIEKLNRYINIVSRNHSQVKFLNGWRNRTMIILEEGLK